MESFPSSLCWMIAGLFLLSSPTSHPIPTRTEHFTRVSAWSHNPGVARGGVCTLNSISGEDSLEFLHHKELQGAAPQLQRVGIFPFFWEAAWAHLTPGLTCPPHSNPQKIPNPSQAHAKDQPQTLLPFRYLGKWIFHKAKEQLGHSQPTREHRPSRDCACSRDVPKGINSRGSSPEQRVRGNRTDRAQQGLLPAQP